MWYDINMANNIKWRLVESPDVGKKTLTVYDGSNIQTINNSHINFDLILKKLQEGSDDIKNLLNVSEYVGDSFAKVTNKVSISNGQVLYLGKALNSTLTKEIVEALREGSGNTKKLVKFLESLMESASDIARESLYDWIKAVRSFDHNAFQINEDGSFIAYKACQEDEEGNIVSINAGPGIVNGKEQNGHLNNNVGNIVEMARFKVTEDRSRACARGLHCGTLAYAKNFGLFGCPIVKVKVFPSDVVSVPNESSAQKIRTCKYEVLEKVENVW